jgi:hypothetical protein
LRSWVPLRSRGGEKLEDHPELGLVEELGPFEELGPIEELSPVEELGSVEELGRKKKRRSP